MHLSDPHNHQNPYANLSSPNEPDDPPTLVIPMRRRWNSKSEIYRYVADCISVPELTSGRAPLLRQFAEIVLTLSARAQGALEQRISAQIPDLQIAHNRLAPAAVNQLLTNLVEMADDAKALDATAE